MRSSARQHRRSLVAGGWFSSAVVLLLISSCAQILTPGGGAKDIKPPRAVKYVPDSAAVNFNSKSIMIAFDEFIQLNDLSKNLFISPPMHVQPEIKVNGKMMQIELKDTLKKNTTYAINFGSAITDFTEGNAKAGFQYIFSTGTYIDSLKLLGTVKNAFDGKTEKGILVMLYDVNDDSIPYKAMPSYFAKTNDDGSYKISNIGPGTYKAFALKELNGNYRYDGPPESIAFSDSLIRISKNTTLNFSMFTEEASKQKMKRAAFAEHGHLVFSFAKPILEPLKFRFISEEPKDHVIYEYSANRDTLHYWFADDLKDTMKIVLSEGNRVLDTAKVSPITLAQAKKQIRGGKWKLNTSASVSKDKKFDYKNNMAVTFSHPVIMNSLTDKIHITGGLKTSNYAVTPTEDLKNKVQRTASFNIALAPDSSYHLFISPGTFTDIFGNPNDTVKVDFKTQEEKFYGTLKMNIKMKKTSTKCIVQFIDEKGILVSEEVVSESKSINYSYIYPGKCKMKLIYDTNGDSKWTTGDYLKHRQAEKIIICPGEINIRSNWDLESDWNVQ